MYSEISKIEKYDVDIMKYLPKNINKHNINIEFISIVDKDKLLTDFSVWRISYAGIEAGNKEGFSILLDFDEGTIYEFALYGEEITKTANKDYIKKYINGYTKYLGLKDFDIYEYENMIKVNIKSLDNVSIEYIYKNGIFMYLKK